MNDIETRRTRRQQLIAGVGLLVVGGLAAAWATGWLDKDKASVVAAFLSVVAAAAAWEATGRASDTANQAGRTAEQVAAIEQARWHADLTPQFNVTIAQGGAGSTFAMMRVELKGPAHLDFIDGFHVQVRDDGYDHQVGGRLVDEPGATDPASVVWGPYALEPGIDGSSPDGRQSAEFPIALGDFRPLAMRKTLAPSWAAREHWEEEYRGKPVRLWIVCHKGKLRWRLSHEVVPVEPAAPTPASGGAST